ncbi:MAG TPA: hypothetical protein VNU94_09385 [Acidobacteriaceae bacterium]|jgi:hypothetical protein|nr:hypothetical protein [Acidobacteriaceae bacterium]
MANVNEHDHHYGPKAMPASLAAPEIVSVWRTRLLILAAVSGLVSLLAFSFTHEGRNHLLRAYLMGYMTCFGFAGGGLVLLMLQHVTGGKWGLLLRRPLEAMTRTLPLVALFFIPIAMFWSHLYQWAKYPTADAVAQALANHEIDLEHALVLNAKRAMLSPAHVGFITVVIFLVLLIFMKILNRWSLERDADPAKNTQASYDRWRTKFENLSGPGILIYVILLTAGAICWIKSLDITWYSSIWGLQFLVAQGYSVLALSILTVIKLSKFEPMKTFLRKTEQHDLGKLAFAFVMLNIYLCFAEFLIIWSGNVPDEIPWYLNRIHGGWWTICSLDFICHWVIPFCLLLSRDLKRNKTKMVWLASWMIFARCVDMFWLIEPNFPDAAGNLHIAGNIGILAYITVPVCVLSVWGAYYLTQLKARPLIAINDPHVEEILEPEHAH